MPEPLSHTDLLNELNDLKLAHALARNELEETRYRLEEANEMLEAIRSGDVDALVVKAADGHQLYTLKSSDQTYRIFIEQMTAGAVTLNKHGAILYCNSRFAKLLGLPLEKVMGKLFSGFFAADSRNDCEELILNSWTSSGKAELNLLTSANLKLPVLLSVQTLNLDEGLAMSVIITDLTEQKEHQQQLENNNKELQTAQQKTREMAASLEHKVIERTKELYNNQERLTQILETMAEGVSIVDLAGKLTYSNAMAQKILGITKENGKEQFFTDPLWPRYRLDGKLLIDAENPVNVTIQTGKPVYDYEIGVQPPNGDRFFVSINAAPIRNEDGEIAGAIATFMDVTHRRKALEQKDEFISVASHELKTPITSLKASLQLMDRLKNNPSSPMFLRLIDQSNKSLGKVSTLINDLLNATRVTDGQLKLNRTEFLVLDLINESCQPVREEGIYKIVANGDPAIKVTADIDKVEQVLVNFVNNAVKYAANSTEIRIDFTKKGNTVRIAVSDQGPGVAPDKLPYLFERFFRVDSGAYQYSGLGLGLYISSQIIKKHNGEIGVESELGKGSTFWFTLPVS